ncbi:hypothetical protein PGT21_018170 [Puccinia graminis f. sp. tritici]|uniref:Uncharacterized protein n=1 Tax=Puccinia graminis f. sp. tritici TaxID=56615 RepID=A0A5B0MX15_PUCGR|nr:hypothetical protein PGT21_018170 [Puccinia graminis f. sp. tritici]
MLEFSLLVIRALAQSALSDPLQLLYISLRPRYTQPYIFSNDASSPFSTPHRLNRKTMGTNLTNHKPTGFDPQQQTEPVDTNL